MQKNSKLSFYTVFFVLLGLIIVMLFLSKPVTFFSQNNISYESSYMLLTFETANRIETYKKNNGIYPVSLKSVSYVGADSLDKMFEYKVIDNYYYLRTKIPVYDTLLIITRDSVRKIAYDE